MKRTFLPLVALIVFALSGCNHSITSYVNPMVGTGGHGHTYPGAIVPFGMIQPSPDTRLNGWDGCSGYHYSDDTLYGFSHTHLSGTGCEDYGDVLLMPFSDSVSIDRNQYRSSFSHRREQAKAGYYSVILDNSRVLVELTATERTALHRYTYPYSGTKGFLIDLTHRDKTLSSGIRLHEDGTLTGWRFSSAWNPEQKLFFAINPSAEVDHVVFYKDDQPVEATAIDGENCKAVVYLKEGCKEAELQVAISAVDEQGALLNLATSKDLSFEEAHKQANAMWESELGKIVVKGKDRKAKKNFYTALYHCMTSPYLYSDVDGRYRAMNDSILTTDGKHNIYTVFSLWDTYRTLHPLLTLIDRKRTEDFIYTFAQQYATGGELTMWELASHETHCMIGYHACPVILEAMNAGIIDNFDQAFQEQLLEAMMATSNRTEAHQSYASMGYLSSEIDNESVSKTLEYSYDDWCIAHYASWLMNKYGQLPVADSTTSDTTAMASTSHHPLSQIVDTYTRRSQSWRNIMDENGFMHPRRNGGFTTPFSPAEVNNHFTEANSWQYSTYVVHDLFNYFNLLGGNEKAEQMIDSLFHTTASLEGRDQADITGLIGQYAHGNEPSHHAAYLYAYLGKQDKTAKLVRQICNELYTPNPDGLCGNEDCGQMSAWYVMSAMGFYPVCPGSGEYVIGSPLFEEVDIHLENGATILIDCDHQSQKNCYVQSYSVNGVGCTAPYLPYRTLADGAHIHFKMGSKPSGALYEAFDGSTEKEQQPLVTMPYFSRWEQRFDGSATIDLKSLRADSIFYRINDGEWMRYTEPFTIQSDATLMAYAVKGTTRSNTTIQHLTRFVADKKLSYITQPADQYRDSGEEGLIDRMRGEENYRIGGWQGWQTDMKVVVDLLAERSFSGLSLSLLSDCHSWIFLPSAITVEVSSDGTNYSPYATNNAIGNYYSNNGTPADAINGWNYKLDPLVVTADVNGPSVHARYVRITATNYGAMPKWHISAGEQAWLFCSEIDFKDLSALDRLP